MSLASVLEAICNEYGIHSTDDFILALTEEADELADFARESAAAAAKQAAAEQVAVEQAAHVLETLRFQIEIRCLAIEIGMQEQVREEVISARVAADRAAADRADAEAEHAAAARALADLKSLHDIAKKDAAAARDERKRAARERTAADAARVKLAKEERAAAHAARERERSAAASAEQRKRDATAHLLVLMRRRIRACLCGSKRQLTQGLPRLRGLLVTQVRRRQSERLQLERGRQLLQRERLQKGLQVWMRESRCCK